MTWSTPVFSGSIPPNCSPARWASTTLRERSDALVFCFANGGGENDWLRKTMEKKGTIHEKQIGKW
jgi:hypothetical protein